MENMSEDLANHFSFVIYDCYQLLDFKSTIKIALTSKGNYKIWGKWNEENPIKGTLMLNSNILKCFQSDFPSKRKSFKIPKFPFFLGKYPFKDERKEFFVPLVSIDLEITNQQEGLKFGFNSFPLEFFTGKKEKDEIKIFHKGRKFAFKLLNQDENDDIQESNIDDEIFTIKPSFDQNPFYFSIRLKSFHLELEREYKTVSNYLIHPILSN
eukprot:TRINITY_DN9468_c0_g1_i1.p1 TRINITY_DN9468_c0_g1~~TRINITY_DN9468_c0_g1_i1.p1  ORF type:complete len:211 (+),score=49.48 TRINITY_DN9468_c0_g1_i1:69-701(+)